MNATSLRAHSTFTSEKKEWAVDFETSMEKARTQHVYVWDRRVGGSHWYELTSAERSDNDKTYELPDDYIITVWRRNE